MQAYVVLAQVDSIWMPVQNVWAALIRTALCVHPIAAQYVKQGTIMTQIAMSALLVG